MSEKLKEIIDACQLPVRDKGQSVMDSSSYNDLMTCPRMFFFKKLLGWRAEPPAHDATFGKAWHKAMEILWTKGREYDNLPEAYEEFKKEYRKEFPEETDYLFDKKSPTSAGQALVDYIEHYMREDKGKETLMCEISGTVAIAEDRRVFFRMDNIVKSQGKIFSFDHKTKGGDFSVTWENSLLTNFQTGCYTHVLNCLYSPEHVAGVVYDGVSFKYLKKTKSHVIQFRRVPAYVGYSYVTNWLYSANAWWDFLEGELEKLTLAHKDDAVLESFPHNWTACTKFFGCQFLDFCMAWTNPLKQAQAGPPPGFKTYFFDPRDEESNHKLTLGDVSDAT